MSEKSVIIGGTSGMGLATAKRLAAAGHKVIISGRSEATVEAALKELGENATGYLLDFAQSDSFAPFFQQVGPFDHLALVGSGKAAWGPFKNLKLDNLKVAFEQKLYGFFLCTQYALPNLRKDGSIVFVIGGASRSAILETSGVAAVNGAIQAMAFTLVKELAPLRINILSPGLVDTPVYDWMKPEEKKAFFQQMGGNLPVGRVGRPDEIAAGIEFLFKNPFVTGAILDIDGGGRLH